MILWSTRFETLQPFAAVPRLLSIESEEQYAASYYHAGRTRSRDTHSIFKYTLDGEGRYWDGNGEHAVPAGTGFLCEIRDPRTAYGYPPEGRGPWRFVYVSFAGETATRWVRELTGRYGSLYRLPRDAGILRRVRAYEARRDTVEPVTASEGADLVFQLLVALAHSKEVRRWDEPGNVLVRTAAEAVRARVDRNLNVTELAGLLGVSREHLSRMFKRHMGMTAHAYIQRQRAYLACRLLKETTLTAKEISARLAFPSPTHFTRMFRKVLRMTPTEFRAVGAMPVL